jgi:Ca2+-binding EF-hand superfamily protein
VKAKYSGSLSRLSEEFEKFDERNQGVLDVANFKTCLMNLKIGLQIGQINNLVRYLEKDKEGMIAYCDFFKAVESASG